MDAWETGGYPLTTLSTSSVHDLHRQLKSGQKVTVLDVRTEGEWNAGHIEGAIHIHGGKLQERFAEVPRDKPVAVVCGSGYRASIAASFLQREKYDDVSNVIGGMSAWKAASLPVTTD
jgi:hydroxyacylglutathione hydrolase